jgi:hypothetical protein
MGAPDHPDSDAAASAEIREVSGDLLRLQALLDDACLALVGSFSAVTQDLAELKPRLDAEAHARMHAHLHAAITGLQFQDIATQLIASARARLDDLAGEGAGAGLMAPTAAGPRPNPVRQANMAAGSIELF